MSQQVAIELIRNVLMAAMWISLPLLSIMFLTGIVVSLVQILTSIQDPSFSSIPRLAAFFGTMLLLLPWILMRTTDYAVHLLGDLGKYAH